MYKSVKAVLALTLGAAVFMGAHTVASMKNMQTMNASTTAPAMVGNMSIEEFNRQNEQGAAAVAAITPDSTALSKADEKLMMDVSMAGMMQLELGKVAVSRATNEEARVLAQSEVDEQTGLGNKLKEIAVAKNITLPSTPDNKTLAMVNRLQSFSGMDFDKYYVKESGIKNHEKLDKLMGKVESSATDSTLKGVATAAHPLVRTHLQVSREVVNKMSGKMAKNSSMSGNMSSSVQ